MCSFFLVSPRKWERLLKSRPRQVSIGASEGPSPRPRQINRRATVLTAAGPGRCRERRRSGTERGRHPHRQRYQASCRWGKRGGDRVPVGDVIMWDVTANSGRLFGGEE